MQDYVYVYDPPRSPSSRSHTALPPDPRPHSRTPQYSSRQQSVQDYDSDPSPSQSVSQCYPGLTQLLHEHACVHWRRRRRPFGPRSYSLSEHRHAYETHTSRRAAIPMWGSQHIKSVIPSSAHCSAAGRLVMSRSAGRGRTSGASSGLRCSANVASMRRNVSLAAARRGRPAARSSP